ncbi:SCO0930 family lipoprotein [Streptomyces sp. P1-3]|uniref:SCO0930 family lipoprotein n=1 Tax=Streptomyces sp. P1-3 TaxID=3421658 RepID=UPI003D366836
MRNRRHAALAGTAVAVIMLTAACGGSDTKSQGNDKVQPAGDAIDKGYGAGDGSKGSGYGYGSSEGSGSGESGGYGDGKSEAGAPAKKLAVRDVPELGPVVTDSKGWTLYRFDKDTAKPPASNCDGDCAAAWPPVPAADATASSGIDPELLGEVTRADGSKQLTLGGWPVYRYAKDTAPGDTKGHGVGGTWNALAPDGKKAGQTADKPKAPEDAAELSTMKDAKLGEIIVDGKWMTLYRFNKDSAWPMKSACVDACLDTWKPAAAVDKAKVKGVNAKLVSTFTRPDGTKQLAVDCWPVYTFTGDTEPGDTNGQGKQGLWFAVTKDGKKAGAGAGQGS